MQLGKYELLKKIATGGMAEVFLARAAGPKGFQKILVVKRILPHLQEDPTFVDMFLSEAKLAAQFSHPNIVQIFDFGEADGISYIAMEFVDGPNLRTLQGRALDFGTPLPLGVCAKIVGLACEGLAYAHDFVDPTTGQALGVVHRDISPDNLLVARNGYVKVVDFGIAKATGQSHKTRTGTIKGKFGYMSPEQLQNQVLDRRTDVFALGMVLYELVTGTKPYDGSSEASTLKGILFEPFIPAVSRRADVPRELGAIIDRALAKEREQRYPDCRALQADLERFIASTGQPVSTLQISELVGSLAVPNLAADLQGTPAPRILATPSPSPAVDPSFGIEPTAASAKSGKYAAMASAQPAEDEAFAATRAKAPAVATADPDAFAATQARAPAAPAPAAPVASPRQSRVAQAPSIVVDPSAFGSAGTAAPAPARAPARDPELEAAMAKVKPSPLRWILPVAAFLVLGTCGVGVMLRSASRAAIRRDTPRLAFGGLGGRERVRRADDDLPSSETRSDDARPPRPEVRTEPVREPVLAPPTPPPVAPPIVAEAKPEPKPEPVVEDKRMSEALPDRREEKLMRRRRRGEKAETRVAAAAEPAPAEPPAPSAPAVSPGNYEALVASATKSLHAHKAVEALQEFQKAVELEPHRAEAHTGEGWSLLELDKPREAVTAFKRALKAKKDHGPALVGLGIAYRKAGDDERAAQSLLRYQDLYPEGPLVQMAKDAMP